MTMGSPRSSSSPILSSLCSPVVSPVVARLPPRASWMPAMDKRRESRQCSPAHPGQSCVDFLRGESIDFFSQTCAAFFASGRRGDSGKLLVPIHPLVDSHWPNTVWASCANTLKGIKTGSAMALSSKATPRALRHPSPKSKSHGATNIAFSALVREEGSTPTRASLSASSSRISTYSLRSSCDRSTPAALALTRQERSQSLVMAVER